MGGANEGFRKVDTEDPRDLSRQFKGSAADGTAQVENPVGTYSLAAGLRQEEASAGPGKVPNAEGRPEAAGQKSGGLEIMKSQILRKGGGSFVG